MSAAQPRLKRTVVERLPKGLDLEVHVSLVSLPRLEGGGESVDIRDYVPSTKTYGRGLVLPVEMIPFVREAMTTAGLRSLSSDA